MPANAHFIAVHRNTPKLSVERAEVRDNRVLPLPLIFVTGFAAVGLGDLSFLRVDSLSESAISFLNAGINQLLGSEHEFVREKTIGAFEEDKMEEIS